MKVAEWLFVIPIVFAFFFMMVGVFNGIPLTASQVIGSLFTSIINPFNTGGGSIWAAIGGVIAFALGTVFKNDSLTSFSLLWIAFNSLFTALIVIGSPNLQPLMINGIDMISMIVFVMSIILDVGVIFFWAERGAP